MTQLTFNTQLAKFIPYVIAFCIMGIVVDAGINTAYIYQGQASDGVGATDLILCVAFFAIWVMALTTLTKLGLEVLPHASKAKRAKILPFWLGCMGIIASTSVYMTTATLGLDLARSDDNARIIRKTSADADKIIEYQGLGNQVQTVLNGAVASLESLHQAELNGNVCESGNGIGRCTGLLKNLVKSTEANLNELITLNGQADPIVESIRELQAELKWLQSGKHEDMDYAQKLALIREKADAMAHQVEALKQTLPTLPISRAIDSYNRNWASLGISHIGAKRIQTEVRPIAKRLQPILSTLKNATYISVKGVEYKSEYALLAQSESVRPIIGIAFLLAFMPLMISVCVLILSGGNTPTEVAEQAESGTTIRLNTKPTIQATKH